MYLLGHIAIGYLVAWAFARWRKQKLSLWIAFTVGIVPDYDILFQGLGLVHHTYTHSLLLWVPIAIALVLWKIATLPYVAGILSHLLIGDFLVSSIPPLLPLSSVSVGLRLGMPSTADALLEPIFLFLMLLIMLLNGDLHRALSGERRNFLMVVPLVSMASLTWLAAEKPEFGGLVVYGFSRLALGTISIGQIFLGLLFVISIAVTCIKESGLSKRHYPKRLQRQNSNPSQNLQKKNIFLKKAGEYLECEFNFSERKRNPKTKTLRIIYFTGAIFSHALFFYKSKRSKASYKKGTARSHFC